MIFYERSAIAALTILAVIVVALAALTMTG
jgi:hypothetical protein